MCGEYPEHATEDLFNTIEEGNWPEMECICSNYESRGSRKISFDILL